MKKLFLAIAVLLCAILALAACGPKEPPHEHSYNETVIYDATCTAEGILRITCSCGYSEDQAIPAKGHTIAYKKALDPDCQQRGYYEHFYCEDCNKNFHDQSALDEYPDAELYIDKLEHEYEYQWVWDGVESATISIYCVAGCEFEYEHTVTDICSYTAYYPTCTMDGEMYYSASYNFNGWTISDSKTAPIPALNHKWGEPEWTWDGKTASASFCCENDEYHVEVITATISSEVTQEPTCHSLGATTYTATVSFGGETYTDTKKIYDVARLDHTPTVDTDSWYWSNCYQEDEIANFDKLYTAKVTLRCSDPECGAYIEQVDATISAEMTTPVLCDKNGEVTYTASYTVGDDVFTATKTRNINYPGHKFTDSNLCINCTYSGMEARYDSTLDGYYITRVTVPNGATKIIIPATFNNRKVLGVSNLYDVERVEEIILMDGIEHINLDVLAVNNYNDGLKWPNLKKLVIPDSVTRVEFSYYYASDIANYCTLYENGYYVGSEENPYRILVTIEDTTITEFTLHPDTEIVAATAFGVDKKIKVNGENVNLTFPSLAVVNMGAKVSGLSLGLFERCTALGAINIDSANPNYKTIGGIVYNADVTKFAFIPSAISGDIVIPDTVVDVIPRNAFRGSSITSLDTGDGVTGIENGVGVECNSLTSLIIGDSVVYMGKANGGYDYCFSYCTALKTVSFGASLESVVSGSFYSAPLVEVNVENLEKFITTSHFGFSFSKNKENPFDCNITLKIRGEAIDTLVVPDGIEAYSLNLSKYNVLYVDFTQAKALRKICTNSFYGNSNILRVGIPEWVTEIERDTFINCPALVIYCAVAEQPAGWHQYWNHNVNYSRPLTYWDVPNTQPQVIIHNNLRYQIDRENKTAYFLTQSAALRGDANGVFEIPSSFNYEGTVYTVTGLNGNSISSPYITKVILPTTLAKLDNPVNSISDKIVVFRGSEAEFKAMNGYSEYFWRDTTVEFTE